MYSFAWYGSIRIFDTSLSQKKKKKVCVFCLFFVFCFFLFGGAGAKNKNRLHKQIWKKTKKKQLFSPKMINTFNNINKLVSTPASDCKNEWKSKYKIIVLSKSSVHSFFLYFLLYTVSPTGRFCYCSSWEKRGSVQPSHWFLNLALVQWVEGFGSPVYTHMDERICLVMIFLCV